MHIYLFVDIDILQVKQMSGKKSFETKSEPLVKWLEYFRYLGEVYLEFVRRLDMNKKQ